MAAAQRSRKRYTRVCDKHYSLTHTPEKNYKYTTTVHINVSSRGLTSSSDNCSVTTAYIYTVETKCEAFRFSNGETLQVLESTATCSAYFQRACHQFMHTQSRKNGNMPWLLRKPVSYVELYLSNFFADQRSAVSIWAVNININK